jgi:MinD superfamily P-loop ATPase
LKQLVILSGKGGTGKTTVSAALAHLASQERSLVLADADVDAANLELVLDPVQCEVHDFWSGQSAVIDPEQCTACGRCAEVCRFDAVLAGKPYRVDPTSCEGCAACFYQCPTEAIRMQEQQAGHWFRSDTRYGPLFHAHLFAGRENSGKLVNQVRQQASLLALDRLADLLLIDGPPGIGCPVISASAGTDLALQVVEPTLSGVHDLERSMATTDHFRVPSLVAINKADINPRRADEIVSFCNKQGVEVVGHIPYDTIVTEAMVHGMPITAYTAASAAADADTDAAAYTDGVVAQALQEVWKRVKRALDKS